MTVLLTHPLVKALWGSLLLAFVGQMLFDHPGALFPRVCLGIVVTGAYVVALACACVLLWDIVRYTPGG
jgi:hypothetical protein